MANYIQTLMDPISTGPDSPRGVKASQEYAKFLLQQATDGKPIQHWAQGLGNLTKALVGGYTEYKAGEQEKAGNQSWINALLANNAAPAVAPMNTPPPSTQPMFAPPPPAAHPLFADQPSISVSDAPAPKPQMANVPNSAIDRIVQVESGGNPNAANPRSTAVGPGQFITTTWLDMIKRHRPDVAAGKSDQELLTLRTDPNLAREMTQAYAQENNSALQSAGFQPTAGNTYLAHFAGQGGALKVLRADPNTPVISVLGPQVVQANPFLATMNTGQLVQWANNKMNGAQSLAPSAAPSAVPNASAGVTPPSSSPAVAPMDQQRTQAAALLANQWTPDAIKAMAAQQILPKGPLTVKEGETLLDPRTFQPIYSNDKNANDYGVVREDQYGNKIYGWTNKRNKSVEETNPRLEPQQQNNAAPNGMNVDDPRNPQIRPVPPNADPKTWREAETKRIQTLTGQRGEQEKVANIVTQDIDRALGIVSKNPNKTTGAIGEGLSKIGGTQAHDLTGLINTIKTNVGFDKLQAMRAASPTGAALGSVTENENRMLQSAIGSLEQSQSPQQLQDNLRRVKNIYMDIIHGPNQGPPRERLSFEQQQQSATPQGAPQAGAVVNGYRFKGGNPNDRASWEKVN